MRLNSLKKWNREDISGAIKELRKLGYLSENILGDITLSSAGIKYMEDKPKRYFEAFAGVVKDLLSLVSVFMPFIP